MSFGNSNGWTNVPSLLKPVAVTLGHHVSERIESSNLLGVGPRRMRSNLENRGRQRQIGNVVRVELVRCNCQSRVDAIRALVRANGIALGRMPDRTNHRPAHARVRMSPTDWNRIRTEDICERKNREKRIKVSANSWEIEEQKMCWIGCCPAT